jgi:hypothetical protein
MSKESELKARKFWFDWLPRHLYRISMEEKSETKLAELKGVLETRPELSVILYFNHISYPDPAFIVNIIQRLDPNQTRTPIAPASYSNTEDVSRRTKLSTWMAEIGRRRGIEIMPVIQTYQRDNPDFGYSNELAYQTYKEMIRKVGSARKPVMCFISQEGHRSDNNVLQEAENGILRIGELVAPVMFIPITMRYRKDYDRKGANFGKEIILGIGEETIQETRKDKMSAEELVYKLAYGLPPKMRGTWGW